VEYCGGDRPIKKVLIANNGNAAIKGMWGLDSVFTLLEQKEDVRCRYRPPRNNPPNTMSLRHTL
jgi:hypothetical protein